MIPKQSAGRRISSTFSPPRHLRRSGFEDGNHPCACEHKTVLKLEVHIMLELNTNLLVLISYE